MEEKTKIGIIICDRYRRCAGGKCFRSLRNREGAFSRYKNREVEIVGYTSCDGCPGGNVEYAVEEMMGNGGSLFDAILLNFLYDRGLGRFGRWTQNRPNG